MTARAGYYTRTEEERLRAALAFAGVGAWEWDLHTGEAWWSDHLYSILARPANAVPTTLAGFLECVLPEDREGVRMAVRELLQTGESRRIACRIVWPDETVRSCRGSIVALPDEAGRCWLICGTLRDATDEGAEHRLPEEVLLDALRAQRAELLAVFEGTPRPLLLVDAQQRILRANSATEEMFGWRAGDLSGRSLQVLSAEPAGMLDALLVAATTQGPREEVTRVVPVVSRGRREFMVEMTVTTAPVADGPRFLVMFVPLASSTGISRVSRPLDDRAPGTIEVPKARS